MDLRHHYRDEDEEARHVLSSSRHSGHRRKPSSASRGRPLRSDADLHVERSRRPSWSLSRIRGEEYARRRDLEANVIHYVLQYARVVNDILNIPRSSDKKRTAEEAKEMAGAFKRCIRKNVDGALEDSATACCMRHGVQFEACRDLSRKLLGSLKALKKVLSDDAFRDFVDRELSNKEISKLWDLGWALSAQMLKFAVIFLLVAAFQAGLFGQAAAMLNIPAPLITEVGVIFSKAGTELSAGIGGITSAVFTVLTPFLEKANLSFSALTAVATSLGAGVHKAFMEYLSSYLSK
jgi:hypothetical protein